MVVQPQPPFSSSTLSSLQKETLYLLESLPFPPSSQLLGTNNLLSASVGLPVLDSSCKWNQTCGFSACILWLGVFPEFTRVTVISGCFIPFMAGSYSVVWIFHIADGVWVIPRFAPVLNAAMNTCVRALAWTCFQCFWLNPWSGVAGLVTVFLIQTTYFTLLPGGDSSHQMFWTFFCVPVSKFPLGHHEINLD